MEEELVTPAMEMLDMLPQFRPAPDPEARPSREDAVMTLSL